MTFIIIFQIKYSEQLPVRSAQGDTFTVLPTSPTGSEDRAPVSGSISPQFLGSLEPR